MLLLLASCTSTCPPGSVLVEGDCVIREDTGPSDSSSPGDSVSDTAATTDSSTTLPPVETTVCGSGGGEFGGLQEAVDAVPSGSTLHVCPWSYAPVEVVAKEIHLLGDGAGSTSIYGGTHPGVRAVDAQLELSGFSITGSGGDDEGGALDIVGGDLTLRDVWLVEVGSGRVWRQEGGAADADGIVIADNDLGLGAAESSVLLSFTDGADVTLRHIRASNNHADNLVVADSAAVDIGNSIFWGSTYGPIAFTFTAFGYPQSVHNTVIHDVVGDGYYVVYGDVTFTNNIVTQTRSQFAPVGIANAYNAYFGNAGGDVIEGEGNLAEDPLFLDVEGESFYLSEGSPCIDAGAPEETWNDGDGTRGDIGAYGGPEGSGW